MTHYEIQDLIRGWLDAAMARLRFWVSVTFAVVAAGFVLGPQLNVSLLVFIIFVFTVVTFIAILMTSMCILRTQHLLEAERALARSDDVVREFVPRWVLRQTRSGTHMLTPVYALGYVGAVIYLLSAAGIF